MGFHIGKSEGAVGGGLGQTGVEIVQGLRRDPVIACQHARHALGDNRGRKQLGQRRSHCLEQSAITDEMHIGIYREPRGGQNTLCALHVVAIQTNAAKGWRELAAGIEQVRLRVGASCVLAPDYGTTGWLAFYLPKGTCVAQQSQRIRWVNMPEPSAAQLAGKLLYVHELDQASLKESFVRAEKVAEVTRKRGPLVVETYQLDVLERPTDQVFDQSPPPELK